MKKKLILVASQKGGSGKSTVSRALLEYYRATEKNVAGYDADGDVGQLYQYYGERDESGKLNNTQDPLHGVKLFDLKNEDQRREMINVGNSDADIVVVDLPAAALVHLESVMGSVQKLMNVFRKSGFDIILILVITPLIASARSVIEAVKMFGDSVTYVIAKNTAFGKSKDFVIFDGMITDSGEKRFGKAKEKLDGRKYEIINFPRLDPKTYALLDMDNLTIKSGINNSEWDLSDREYVNDWYNQVVRMIETSGHLRVT